MKSNERVDKGSGQKKREGKKRLKLEQKNLGREEETENINRKIHRKRIRRRKRRKEEEHKK
jgi:hypothetical protein